MAATAAITAATRVRLVTYNVRRFTAEDGSSTVAEVAASLRTLGPTIVCLNEVDLNKRPGALETVARELGGFHVEFFGHVKGKDGFDRYGNALLSRYPAVLSQRVHLDGGFESEHNGQPYRIHRGLLAVDFALPLATIGGGTLPLTVAATHLDHISEAERKTQLTHVVGTLGKHEHPSGAIVLMGDLNALTRSDYSDEEWAAHERRNAAAGWAAPEFGCLRILDDAGYVDAFAQSALLQDNSSTASQGLAEMEGLWRWTGHVTEPIYRIDYIWTKAVGAGVNMAAAESFVATDVTHSDHYPVVADLDINVAPEAQLLATMRSDL